MGIDLLHQTTRLEDMPLPLSEDVPSDTLSAFDGDELRARCFVERYALRDSNGLLLEKVPEQMWARVAREIAFAERVGERDHWERQFAWLLEDFRMIPGGRILFGAAHWRQVSLMNCYTVPIADDSLDAVFRWCRLAAKTLSRGGGVGVDMSILRPKGASVSNAGLQSPGIIPFMQLFSQTAASIRQAGRQASLMITLRVDHPDIVDFIEIKNDPARWNVRFANISVRVSDAFLKSVRQKDTVRLWFTGHATTATMPAQTIWEQLVRSAWACAEPGVLFWDTIARESTTQYNGMEVYSTNPCSEITLEPYGACCLANINLSRFVQQEFAALSAINWKALERALRLAVRFLDDVIDRGREGHPLPEQRRASLWSRRIGIGFTGFGDMLIQLGYRYDSSDAVHFVDRLFATIKHIVYDESANLARERGSFPAYDHAHHARSPFFDRLDDAVKRKIRRNGLRNAALLAVPPVGSGSVLAGCSSGIEPVFAIAYTRRSTALSRALFQVLHPLVRRYAVQHGLKDTNDLPRCFITAHEIRPELRVLMQATIQRHVDQAISSTINLPASASPTNVEEIFWLAWKLECKGVTIYRQGARDDILSTTASIAQDELPSTTAEQNRDRCAVCAG